MNDFHACELPAESPKGFTRRALLTGFAAGLATLGVSAFADSAQAAAKTYSVGTTASIPVGTAKFFNLGGRRVMVAQPTRGVFKAFAGTCTHETATLTDPGARSPNVTCPRHGATFSKSSGAVVGRSPARSNLARYTVTVASGQVKVTIP